MDYGDQRFDVQALWAKYEDIAMHFNDLLMKLRTQSLAVVAAVATLVGIFAKDGIANISLGWGVAEALLIAMTLFWVAIWCIDFFYYNRLLTGAVTAIKKLELECRPGAAFTVGINMSTIIEDEFRHSIWKRWPTRFNGVFAFYGIVFGVLVAGIWYAHRMHS